jgi:serine/threonine protein kinase
MKHIIGAGSYGNVYKINDTQVVKVAKDSAPKHQILKEIVICKYLNHANVVSYNGVKLYAESLKIIFEYAGTIVKPQHYSMAIEQQIIKAVAYIHSMGVVHRDIKPGNILIKLGQIKLCDFGLSAFISSEGLTGNVGTHYYKAPEVMFGNYTHKVDIWSLGCTLYELKYGVIYYNNKSFQDYNDMLANNPNNRPDAGMVMQTIQHAEVACNSIIHDVFKSYAAYLSEQSKMLAIKIFNRYLAKIRKQICYYDVAVACCVLGNHIMDHIIIDINTYAQPIRRLYYRVAKKLEFDLCFL